MRLIDADKLLRDIEHYNLGDGKFQHWVEIQPTIEKEPQWIPCSERLPEEDGEYLVVFEKGYAEDYGFDLVGIAPYEVDCEGFGIWQERFDHYTLGSLGLEWVDFIVLAWQPLPEPYMEVDE